MNPFDPGGMKLSDAFIWLGVVGVFGLPLAVWKAVEILRWIFDKL